jgi:hypothetical protein
MSGATINISGSSNDSNLVLNSPNATVTDNASDVSGHPHNYLTVEKLIDSDHLVSDKYNVVMINKKIIANLYKILNQKKDPSFMLTPYVQDVNNSYLYAYTNLYRDLLLPTFCENCIGGVISYFLALNGFLVLGDTWNYKAHGDDLLKYTEVQQAFGQWSLMFQMEQLFNIKGNLNNFSESGDPSTDISGYDRISEERMNAMFGSGAHKPIWSKDVSGVTTSDPTLALRGWIQNFFTTLSTTLKSLKTKQPNIYYGGSYEKADFAITVGVGGVDLFGWIIGLMMYHCNKVTTANPLLNTIAAIAAELDYEYTIVDGFDLGITKSADNKVSLNEWNNTTWGEYADASAVKTNMNACRFWSAYADFVNKLSVEYSDSLGVPSYDSIDFAKRGTADRSLNVPDLAENVGRTQMQPVN